MAASSLLLFGPLSSWPNQAYFSELQRSLQKDPELEFLVRLIEELPLLWPILQQISELSTITGAEQLDRLKDLLNPLTLPDSWAVGSVAAIPLTVICQIVEFLRLRRNASNATFPGVDNVQGFCIGFLAAAALASSRDEIEFRHFASVTVRLAVCIGSIVALNEESCQDPLDRSSSLAVRWKQDLDTEFFEKILRNYPTAYISCFTDQKTVTVTVASRDATSLARNLLDSGLSVQFISLRGRYHHPLNDNQVIQQMRGLCNRDTRFQLPDAERLLLPLRSNADSELITQGALHHIALDSILTRQSRWYQTVRATIAAMGWQNIDIKTVGTDSFLPRSILKHKPIPPRYPDERSIGSLGTPDETEFGSSLPDRSSSCPTPCMRSSLNNADAAATTSAIAVVGMACRFSKSDSLDEYWRLICSGTSAVQPLPEDRFDPAKVWRDPKGPFWGNFISDPDTFDHRFFSISGREAKSMDPQQRLLLQVVYEAMESSGYYGPNKGTQPSGIGCYVGVGSVDYEDNVTSENATAFSASGTLRAFVSGRVSHYFGWSGPSITYDTACSSSAVAIHSACKALQTAECSMAVAGGVNVITSPKLFQNLVAGGFLNPKGASSAFDANANGYCRGEGAGIVLLKPLTRAVADGNFVLGVIAGSAINQSSNCTPITVPVTESQCSLYEQALAAAGIEAVDVSYVEAHGTGTSVGDPIECKSIRQAFGGAHRSQELFLGSVKDSIGHVEAASGVAGLIKTILMMQYRTIPKQANFVSLNPMIPPLEQDRMIIPKQTQPWNAHRRAAVINNYGAAGSNAAIVLLEKPPVEAEVVAPGILSSLVNLPDFPIFVSAKTLESLRSYLSALKSYITGAQDADTNNILMNLAFNLAAKQNRSHEHIWTSTSPDLRTLFDKLEASNIDSNELVRLIDGKKPVVLCFGGQTGRVVSLSKELFDNCRLLKLHMVECDSNCKALGLPSIFPGIFHSEPVEDIVELHCRLFSLQYACAKCWLDCGLEVDTLIGHSFGQLTALCVADCLSLEDGIRLISARARLIRDQWGSEAGAMLAVEGDCHDVKALLSLTKLQYSECSAEISCYNGPRSFVLAGDTASIEAIEATLNSQKSGLSVKLQRLKNTHAFHSYLVDSILPDLTEVSESMQFREPSIHFETCSKGQRWPKVDADEIVQHSRRPVYFTDAVERISRRLKSSIWLEAGSGSPIISMIRQILQADSNARHIFQAVYLANFNAQSNLAKICCELWLAGSQVQFWPFHHCQRHSYAWLNLPPYQFEKTRHWIQLKASKLGLETTNIPERQRPDLLRKLKGDSDQALFSVDPIHNIFNLCVKGHAVLHHGLCPASMYIELATRAAKLVAKPTSSGGLPHIKKLDMSSALLLNPRNSIFLELKRDQKGDDTWSFLLFSRSQSDTTGQTTHARGLIALLPFDAVNATSGFQSLKRLIESSRCESIMNAPTANGLSGRMIYKNFRRVVDYAAYYQGVRRVFAKDHEIVGNVLVPNDQPPELDPGSCDPVALDNFLQVAGIHINCLRDCNDDEVFLCTAIREVLFSEQFIKKPADKRAWTVYSNFELNIDGQVMNDIFVLDPESKELVLTLMGAKFIKISLKSLSRTLSKLNDIPQHLAPDNAKEQLEATPTSEGNYENQNGAQTSAHQSHRSASELNPSIQFDPSQILEKLRLMLSEVLEVPVDDIQPNSTLDSLGIDSLMMTEVIGEINSRFGVAISIADFQDLTNVQSLCCRLRPSTSKEVSDEGQRSQITQKPDNNQNPNGVQATKEQISTTFDDISTKGLAAISSNCFTRVKRAFDFTAQKTGFIGFSSHVQPLQSELVLAYVVGAFKTLGCPLWSLNPGQRLPHIHYSSKHSKVVGQLYKILEDGRIITHWEKEIRRTAVKLPTSAAGVLYTSIIERFPQHAIEHKLLHVTGPKLASCLNEKDDPKALLFGNATARALITEFYTNAPMFKAGTILLAQYLADIFDQLDDNREIQILEIGAGTGGTTSILLEMLASRKQKVHYTFTDVSSSLVMAAKKRFAHYEFTKYAILDVEQELALQHLNQYDIVISTNCIHATKNLVTSCTNIRKMLRQDGIFCLIELTRNLFWFDLVFGLLEGWWLFNDGRQHVLADEILWKQNLHQAGFLWVDWTEGDTEESRILRVIVASPSKGAPAVRQDISGDSVDHLETQETVKFAQEGDIELFADITYPEKLDDTNTTRPIALMIHGGGHVMLSRKDVRPAQTQILLEAGFLPVSIDYRLCPETTLLEGPMHDVCSALRWARHTLPSRRLQRTDIRPDGDRVVAIGWSTGGHLAMTLAWTAPAVGLVPPDAILAFYCPTDYEDPFWTHSNMPRGVDVKAAQRPYNLREGVQNSPITSYNLSSSSFPRPPGGWIAPEDARSRICLHMNWQAQTLPILINGLTPSNAEAETQPLHLPTLPFPTTQQIQAISPLAHIRRGAYTTPTFILHGSSDDLVPWRQSLRTYEALCERGVRAQVRIVNGRGHLFDVDGDGDGEGGRAVREGYEFLGREVGLRMGMG